ncbi:MAG: cofC [Frankiales bacterium]|nr:cofC [Frankiales bacterium]
MTQWVLIVPVKRLSAAKTRLALPADLRRSLVLAMLSDTLLATAGMNDDPAAAESAVEMSVLVVTGDASAAAVAGHHGADVLGGEPGGGLNAAIAFGAAAARHLYGAHRLAAMAADLPALRPAELAAALLRAEQHGDSFVADADGTGTTLLCGTGDLRPQFGADSAVRHAASGASRLDGDWPGLRCDVDTLDALAAAAGFGTGPETTALMRRLP